MTAPAADELSRSDPATPGISRRRQGRGFRYLRASSEPVRDPATLARIKSLVIPPAWQEVWICPDPGGHIQATGVDAAGRRQYLYHQRWREEQDQRKFDRMAEFGRALPRIREKVLAELEGRGLHRERVMAAALRLIDLGFFRAGGEEYAAEHETFGLATIRREHVTCGRRQLTFEYPAKGGIQREQAIVDERLCVVVRSLKRRRWGGDELLAWRNGSGRPHDMTAADINDYLREISGANFTAKDFRTWNATVLAAVGLAVSGHAETDSARKRAVARAVQEVAGYLGNTPAVARGSYIDPRVIDRYEHGRTIERALAELGASSEFGELATQGRAEAAVLRILQQAD
ncbi:MAG TPA: DNA topoisomerase IB [Streptosporangiaceae bacterium]|jgi:DNA topoisomerase IB|nr:DNA topoisomerase IB [Streptosporangiaceae bacterium]